MEALFNHSRSLRFVASANGGEDAPAVPRAALSLSCPNTETVNSNMFPPVVLNSQHRWWRAGTRWRHRSLQTHEALATIPEASISSPVPTAAKDV
jgi:hypothetical protein